MQLQLSESTAAQAAAASNSQIADLQQQLHQTAVEAAHAEEVTAAQLTALKQQLSQSNSEAAQAAAASNSRITALDQQRSDSNTRAQQAEADAASFKCINAVLKQQLSNSKAQTQQAEADAASAIFINAALQQQMREKEHCLQQSTTELAALASRVQQAEQAAAAARVEKRSLTAQLITSKNSAHQAQEASRADRDQVYDLENQLHWASQIPALETQLSQSRASAQQAQQAQQADRAKIGALEQQLQQAQTRVQQGVTAAAANDVRVQAFKKELLNSQGALQSAVAPTSVPVAQDLDAAVQTAEHLSPEQSADGAVLPSYVTPLYDSDGDIRLDCTSSGKPTPPSVAQEAIASTCKTTIIKVAADSKGAQKATTATQQFAISADCSTSSAPANNTMPSISVDAASGKGTAGHGSMAGQPKGLAANAASVAATATTTIGKAGTAFVDNLSPGQGKRPAAQTQEVEDIVSKDDVASSSTVMTHQANRPSDGSQGAYISGSFLYVTVACTYACTLQHVLLAGITNVSTNHVWPQLVVQQRFCLLVSCVCKSLLAVSDSFSITTS